MAQRGAGKAKRRPAKGDGPAGRESLDTVGRGQAGQRNADPRQRLRALEAELTAVREQLAAAQARNRELEESHEQARNRIDWVIDSLHNLLEK